MFFKKRPLRLVLSGDDKVQVWTPNSKKTCLCKYVGMFNLIFEPEPCIGCLYYKAFVYMVPLGLVLMETNEHTLDKHLCHDSACGFPFV